MSALLILALLALSVRGQTCEDTGDINHLDWDELMTNETLQPHMNYTIDVNQATLSLVIDAELEYVGYTFADAHTSGYGATFVLDFDNFDPASDNIREAGSCQNRVSSDFENAAWSDIWNYSVTPSETNHIDSPNGDYLAYPNSGDYWNLTIETECTPIHYHGEFSWTELRSCADYGETELYTAVNSDDNWINLTGTFYISLVSPMAHNTDSGYYRAYQLLTAPFVIAIRSSVNIISSVGINLFTLSIIAVFKEEGQSDFMLIVLTESADFLMLSSPELLDDPNALFDFSVVSSDISGGCFTASSNLCSQLWQINALNVTCPPTDFTGSYALDFTTTCNPEANYSSNATALCSNYIATYGAEVGLTASLSWLDEICDPQIFIVQFVGTFAFYNDSAFENVMGASDQYSFEDTAYVQILIDLPAEVQLFINDVVLDNVWVCTTSPDNEPLSVTSQNLGSGGCLTPNSVIDADSKWRLVADGDAKDDTPGGDVIIYPSPQNGTLRFSFFIHPSISRTKLHVHAQVTIDLTEGSRRRQMRMLLAEDQATASQTRHFDGSTDINREFVVVEEGPIDDIVPDKVDEEWTGLTVVTWLIIGCAASLCVACLCGVCLFVSCLRRKRGSTNMAAVLAAMHTMNQQEVDRKNTASTSETPVSKVNNSPVVEIKLETPVSTKVNKVNGL